MAKYDIIIIGAGAAGLMAAGQTARSGSSVLVLEKMSRAGRKLSITGKGRCNITNTAGQSEFLNHIYPSARFLKPAFSHFFNKDLINEIENHGVVTETERGGRVFPVNNDAQEIVKALLQKARTYNAEFRYNTKVEEVLTDNGTATGVKVNNNGVTEKISAHKVIISTGGMSYPATGSEGDGYTLAKAIGHSITPPRPALVPLVTESNLAKQLQGLTLKNVKAIVWINDKKVHEKFGEMLFTHFGLSGPIILSLSRFVVDELYKNSRVKISIDLKPALDEKKLDNRLIRDLQQYGKKQIDNIFKQWLPSKLIPVFLEKTGIDPTKEGNRITSGDRKKIKMLMKEFTFTIINHRSFKEAIITAGGIPTNEIHAKTMESKIQKELYFCGEIIDLDADTGGYNLQIAFSTAWLAANSCIKDITG